MYGLLVVSGITILCLIGLTIVSSRNNKNQSSASMDVEMRPPLPEKKNKKRKKSNPVMRLSKLQENKRNNGDLKNDKEIKEGSSVRQYLPRPPALPLPR